MERQSTEVTVEFLQAFADAWNRHDIDDLISFMRDDCVFESSAGDDVCGTRYEGAEAVRAGFSKNWETFPDARWADDRHVPNEPTMGGSTDVGGVSWITPTMLAGMETMEQLN